MEPGQGEGETNFAPEIVKKWQEAELNIPENAKNTKIKDTVVGLAALGFPTTQMAHEGALDYPWKEDPKKRMFVLPWIGLSEKNEGFQYVREEELLNKVAQDNGLTVDEIKNRSSEKGIEADIAIIEELRKDPQEAETEGFKQLRERNKAMAEKLKTLVDKFYKDRLTADNQKLEVGFMGDGEVTLASHNAMIEMHEINTPDAKDEVLKPKMEAQQKEMIAFGAFLKKELAQPPTSLPLAA